MKLETGRAAIASTGVEYFGLKVCLLVPEYLDIDPKEAAKGFADHIDNLVAKANQPNLKLCEVAAEMQMGMSIN
jgi:hypothetical protein